MKKNILLIIIFMLFNKVIGQEKINPNGYNVFYHPNGKKSSEGYMKNGKPDGIWINYYVTGIKKSEGIRRSNLLDSIWVFFNMYGDTVKKINFLYGKRNGYTYEYSYDNIERKKILIVKELYLNNKKEGTSYHYYNDGKIWEMENYKNGLLDGKKISYAKNGRIIAIHLFKEGRLVEHEIINQYEKGLKTGIWKEFYENGNVMKEMFYKNDTLHGIYKEYDKNGLIRSIMKYESGIIVDRSIDEEGLEDLKVRTKLDENGNVIYKGTYRKNIPVGIHREFDSSGTIVKTLVYSEKGEVISDGIIDLKGKKEGEWKYYYPNGKLQSEGNYVSNRKEGKWVYYYKNENIEQTGIYNRGMANGQWKWYYDNGNVLREENYYNGMNDGMYIEYDEKGKEITKGEYFEGAKEGEWFYFVGDYKEVGKYVTGLKDGKWNYYYKNGQKMFEGEFIQGNPDGKHFSFYPNGIIKEERFYLMGYREKTWKRYDELGNLYMTITYENNIEVKINGIKIKEND